MAEPQEECGLITILVSLRDPDVFPIMPRCKCKSYRRKNIGATLRFLDGPGDPYYTWDYSFAANNNYPASYPINISSGTRPSIDLNPPSAIASPSLPAARW